jgi:uncharacterized protein YjbI with pentapeptide repeats
MVPVSHKKISLDQEAVNGMTSLFQQGSVALLSFLAILLLTGGAPSGLAVGLTVGLSGIFVTWSEQRRLFKKNRSSTHPQSSPIFCRPTLRQAYGRFYGSLKEYFFEDDSNGCQTLDSECNETLQDSSLVEAASLVRSSSRNPEIQNWLEQLESQGISPNKLAILRRKVTEFSPGTNEIEKLQPLVADIVESNDDFWELARLSGLNPLRDFAKSNLKGTLLAQAYLSEAFLHEANLSRAKLINADLSGADLSRADLSVALLVGALLVGANLSGANLSGTVLLNADLSGADLSGADLSGAFLNGANLSGANLHKSDLSGANLPRANLSGAGLSEANLINADLSDADLSGADLYGAVVENTRFLFGRGISSELKRDLQNRGAIFDDAQGDRGRVLVPH